MPIVACGYTSRGWRCKPPAPLVFDPAERAEVDLDPECDAPMLVLPDGLRIRVDAASSNAEAAAWWHALAIAVLTAALFYEQLAVADAARPLPGSGEQAHTPAVR